MPPRNPAAARRCLAIVSHLEHSCAEEASPALPPREQSIRKANNADCCQNEADLFVMLVSHLSFAVSRGFLTNGHHVCGHGGSKHTLDSANFGRILPQFDRVQSNVVEGLPKVAEFGQMWPKSAKLGLVGVGPDSTNVGPYSTNSGRLFGSVSTKVGPISDDLEMTSANMGQCSPPSGWHRTILTLNSTSPELDPQMTPVHAAPPGRPSAHRAPAAPASAAGARG